MHQHSGFPALQRQTDRQTERERVMVTLVNEKTRPDTRQVKLSAGG